MFLKTTFRTFIVGCAVMLTSVVKAQVPQIINYQAVVRDAAGDIVKNKVVNFRLSILDGSTAGTPQYVETQSKTTNQFGLVTFGIGQGATVSGAMSAVTWATSSKFLKVELDINGGNTFSLMSTSQFLSVPFALYAATSGNGSSGSTSQWLNNNVGINYNAGKVGIGTNSPTSKLNIEVNSDGNGEVDDRIMFDMNNRASGSATVAAMKISAGNVSNFTSYSYVSPYYTYQPEPDNGQLWSTGTGGLVLRASPKSGSDPDMGGIRFFTGFVANAMGTQERMRLDKIGNLGIGTTTPKAKVEVANGDVYLNDSTKGIILKSPNGNCWRVTVDNTGNLVRTQITCPQ